MRTCAWINTLLLLCLALASASCLDRAGGASPDSQPNAALQTFVDGKALNAAISAPQMTDGERTRLADQVRRVYADQHYQLIWIDGDRLSARYHTFSKALAAADDHGLPRSLYPLPIDDQAGNKVRISPDQAPDVDTRTTAAFLRYYTHLLGGRLDPRALQSLWTLRPERPDLVNALTTAVKKNDLEATMAGLAPQQPEYRELQKALVRYRAIAAKGGWPSIPANTQLKPNQQSQVVPVLRHRLAIEGDLDPSHETDPSHVFDADTLAAVKRFEERHRIKPDGIVDPATVTALNVPVEQRIRTIELNLERWRWLPDPMPARYFIVNVPDFHLEAIEDGNPVLAMRVVVGEPDNKTPIFADSMTHVVFSPYWNVPAGIAKDETIPRAARDPRFLDRNNMEVVTASGAVVDPSSIDWSNPGALRIRQRPGSGNALGGVKFIFPNNFDVYLHDTNATTLFDRIERGLSHGCVRVEEPHKLAQYVLREQTEWTPEAIAAAMTSGQEKHVKLTTPIPVYIVYKTAWVHDGGVRFLKDLYGYDADQAARLFPASLSGEVTRALETRR